MSVRIYKSGAQSAGNQFKGWLERIVKLIPGEVIAAYTVVRALGNTTFQEIVWPLLWLVLTYLIRMQVTKDPDNGRPKGQLPAALISCGAFAIWVYVSGGNFFGIAIDAGVMSGVMVAYSVAVSAFYQGE